MIGKGTEVPTFALPGVVDGAIQEVDLAEYVGDGIIVLVFYPADFSPACNEESCELTVLDLFTMQKDVDIFGISADSVYSHRAFAEEYALSIPLLSDIHGEVIDKYGVRYEDGDGFVSKHAVFLIDQRGVVQYTWSTDDLEERPYVDVIREAISNIGGDSTAVSRYRVGHAHYVEGRHAFTSAMNGYEDHDWLISQGDFERAMEEFQKAAEQFQSAVRFAESGPLEGRFERAQEKSTALWQAAEWLADSASEYGSGNGDEAEEYRQDAEFPLETARDIGEPPDPEDIDLDADVDTAEPAQKDDSDALKAPSGPTEEDNDTTPGGGSSPADSNQIEAAIKEVEVELENNETEAQSAHGEYLAGTDTNTNTIATEAGSDSTRAASDSPALNQSASGNENDAELTDEVPDELDAYATDKSVVNAIDETGDDDEEEIKLDLTDPSESN